MYKNYADLKDIEIVPYNENEGLRRCNACLAFTGEGKEVDYVIGARHTDKMFELIIGGGNGGFKIILCKKCLNEVKEKIEEGLKEND